VALHGEPGAIELPLAAGSQNAAVGAQVKFNGRFHQCGSAARGGDSACDENQKLSGLVFRSRVPCFGQFAGIAGECSGSYLAAGLWLLIIGQTGEPGCGFQDLVHNLSRGRALARDVAYVQRDARVGALRCRNAFFVVAPR
jgi:hypothetical protein